MNSSNKSDPFKTDHLLKALKAHTARSTAVSAVAQGIKFVIQLISIVVMARLLPPSDFGLIAMATVMTGILGMAGDGGLSMATIQRAKVTHGQVSNLFWFNVVLGLALCILTVAMAPIVALIYGEPRLNWICVAISATFLVRGLSVQHSALLVRQMRFKAIAYIDVLSMACGVVAGICAAGFGMGYWALVVLPICTTICQVICTWLASDWRPSWWQRGTGVRPLLNFGATLTGANFVGYLASNITPFAVGLIGGAQQLGLYNRANTLTTIPSNLILSPIMSVVQPALARVVTDAARFRSAALSLMRKICLLAMFITVTMAVMADWIVEIFLGPGWNGAVTLFRLLAIFSLVEPVASVISAMMIATGQADALLKWKAITLSIVALSLFVGSFWGINGIVVAYALSGLLVRLPLFLIYATHYLPISISDFAKVLFPFFTLAIILLFAMLALRNNYGPASALWGLTLFLPLSFMFYLLIGLAMKPVRREIRDLYNIIFPLLRSQRP